jgi:hypothetical protein
MKARITILTAAAVAALTCLAVQSAGATIPGDGGASYQGTVHALPVVKAHTTLRTHSGTAIDAGTYAAYAYVQGGSSQVVAKAITSAGKKLYRKGRPLLVSIKGPVGEAVNATGATLPCTWHGPEDC